MRLDKLIAQRFGLSRRSAQEAVRKGQVDVAGRQCLEPGQEVEDESALVFNPNRPRLESTPRLKVLYEERQFLVIDKPAGLLTHPSVAGQRDTLLELASRYLARKRKNTRPYVGIVHRLDKDTSGALLLVTAPQALRPFQALFRTHAIERTYLAVVEGVFITPAGRIDLRLVRDRGDGRPGIARQPSRGVSAVTNYEVQETFGQTASLISCRLETGRTHQIRIHLAEIGHPVLGDPVYRPKGLPAFPIPFARQALHAQALGLVHPITGQVIQVEAPLPADLVNLTTALRRRFGSSSGRP
jgi:23S rRNA pseudouridine1911/1915/1917 synthase